MRVICVAALAALNTGAAANAATPARLSLSVPVILIADTTTDDNKTAPNGEAPSPGAPSPNSPPANSGQLEVQPGPQPQQPSQPSQPPNLSIPSPPVTPSQPGQTSPEGAPPSETLEQHQEPPPRGQAPGELPRGEGAAMIPKETPSGIKAVEDWIWSWFE